MHICSYLSLLEINKICIDTHFRLVKPYIRFYIFASLKYRDTSLCITPVKYFTSLQIIELYIEVQIISLVYMMDVLLRVC